MRDLLPSVMVFHAAHWPGLDHFHDRENHLKRETRDGLATAKEHHFSARELAGRALQKLRGRRATERA